MKDGQVKMTDINEIKQKARVNANKKPAFNIHLSHLSDWRSQQKNQNNKNDMAKLEVIQSFTRVREFLQKELESVCGH